MRQVGFAVADGDDETATGKNLTRLIDRIAFAKLAAQSNPAMSGKLADGGDKAAGVGCSVNPHAKRHSAVLAVNDAKLKNGAVTFAGRLKPGVLAND